MSDATAEIVIKDTELIGRIRRIAAAKRIGPVQAVSRAMDALEFTPEWVDTLTDEQRELVVHSHFSKIGRQTCERMTPERRSNRSKFAALTKWARNRWPDRTDMLAEFEHVRELVGPKRYMLACRTLEIKPYDFDEVSGEALDAFNRLLEELEIRKEDLKKDQERSR